MQYSTYACDFTFLPCALLLKYLVDICGFSSGEFAIICEKEKRKKENER